MKTIHIVHLYPQEMNIYGDNGNLISLKWRLLQRGFEVKITNIGLGDNLPTDLDILFAGGGQDSGQERIKNDLQNKAVEIRAMAEDGTVMLMICGMYQLFGHYFETGAGNKIPGIGVLDAFTVAGNKRLIGNIVLNSRYGKLVGFENHSGQTYLGENQLSLGKVVRGYGNNQSVKSEGAIINNVFGSYLHGPLLPKNPVLADELLLRALSKRHGITQLEPIDDTIALRAAAIAAKRP